MRGGVQRHAVAEKVRAEEVKVKVSGRLAVCSFGEVVIFLGCRYSELRQLVVAERPRAVQVGRNDSCGLILSTEILTLRANPKSAHSTRLYRSRTGKALGRADGAPDCPRELLAPFESWRALVRRAEGSIEKKRTH